MPGESTTFTLSSILFRPRHNLPPPVRCRGRPQALVEAPGTAPGSDELIMPTIYRHIRLLPAKRI